MAGMGLFTLSSFVAGLAPTMASLITARLVQGAAGGIINGRLGGGGVRLACS